MKTQSLTMGLAFLVGAFMWGCQEQGSSPVGLEGLGPQFDKPSIDPPNPNCDEPDVKGHCHDEETDGDATFTATWTKRGDITGDPIDIKMGPNWDDDLSGTPDYARNDPNLENLSDEEREAMFQLERMGPQ